MDKPSTKADIIINWLRNYSQHRLNSRLIDERRCIPPNVVLDLGNRGILGMQIGPEYGGIGLNNSDSMRVVEQLAAIDLTLATFVVNNDFLGIRPIQNYATREVKAELLPLLAGGRELASFALTEPVAGSNPQAIATTGIPDGKGGWNLRGTKVWSGSAGWAGVVNVFAKLLDTEGKTTGISGFAIRQGTPGFRIGAESLTMGMRGMVQNFLHLDDTLVTPEDLLGNEGEGLKAANDGMLHTRLAIGAMCVGGMKRCLQLMLRYSSRRAIGTGLLLENPVTLARISNLTAATTAFAALIERLAELLDRGKSVPAEAYMACKIAGPEFLWQTADALVQLLGGRGYIETNIASQILRDARIFRIFEGPTETLTMFLGSRILHQNEELELFLSKTLNAPELAYGLQETASQINERWSQSNKPFNDSAAALRWAAMAIGEIATYSLLIACLRSSWQESPQIERAIVWAQEELERVKNRALGDRSLDRVFLNALSATETISSYVETIGDLEQTLAGEDVAIDSLLRKEIKENIQEREDVAIATPRAEIVEGDRSRSSVETWLVDWIAKQVKTSSANIDLNKSLFHYGLDSVTTIALLSDLEDWVDREFPPALIWNYPVIKDLANYLTSELNLENTPNSTEELAKDIDSAFINIELLSDSEVDSLLEKLMVED